MLPSFAQYTVLVVISNVLLEQIGLPLPAFPTLIVAGALASHRGELLAELFAGAAAACLITDLGWYWAGRRYGSRVMQLLCRISLNPDSCVNETQIRFERWGPWALVVAKFVPGLATVAAPLAGAARMGGLRFVLYAALGTAAWVAAGLGAGLWIGPPVLQVLPHVARFGAILVCVIGVLLCAYIAYKWLQRRRFLTTLRMARISVAELYQLIDAGAAPTIVDVRSSTARAIEPRRIPGAKLITMQEVGLHLNELPRDREIVMYCSCPNEASAAQAAKILMSHGFRRVRPLQGGLEAWIAAGYGADVV